MQKDHSLKGLIDRLQIRPAAKCTSTQLCRYFYARDVFGLGMCSNISVLFVGKADSDHIPEVAPSRDLYDGKNSRISAVAHCYGNSSKQAA